MTNDEFFKIIKDINYMSNEDRKFYFRFANIEEIISKMVSADDLIAFYEDYKKAKSFKVGDEVKIIGIELYGWVTYVGDAHVTVLLHNGDFSSHYKNNISRTGRYNVTLAKALQNNMKDCKIVTEV